MWIWPVIGVVVILLIVIIINQSTKQ